ncbi:uncharacterized protein LOC130674639 [Microplitis mediator]|uniref:uncharacterized protein LOC130674639 n=1 Tax=Microplitis mediator TaxID=375433 RepID=UPI0025542408|nr:uncharacterized protein LOC130674639 [Microplitis mediator]XP_057336013.1 uncharacterized protein LOC130674639 [Microplitis mediator]
MKCKVIDFYVSDDISVNLPGKKDFLSIRNNEGKREHVQKKLILCNLKELYETFKEQNPENKIGFSTFASLRPPQCVLAGSGGTHTVCVCAVHQNIKLMMLGSNLASLTRHLPIPLVQYQDCFKLIVCPNPSSDCYFQKCPNCPGIKLLEELLETVFDENEIDDITYKYWISNPRCSLETFIKSSSDFIEIFSEHIVNLLPHDFIAKQQSSFLKSKKESLKDNESLVICDFAENYAFVIQDAVPGFHWNNNQVTIFPVVIYFKQNNEITHRSLIIISDNNHHDTVAVYVYLKIITDFIKDLNSTAAKVFYFSDGAPQQFKNFKNFVNIYYHKEDFNLDAEWHFFATAHGKGPCDGIGGVVKRKAAKASLQRPIDNQITTPEEFYEWAVEPNSLPSIAVKFSPESDYVNAREKLELRYITAKSITGTQKFHCIIPVTNGSIKAKEYSNSNLDRTCKLFKNLRK